MTDNLNTLAGDELKPCPFCGGEARSSENWVTWDTREWAAYCYNDCGGIVSKRTKAEAITAWNTRAHPQPTGDVGALEATIETVTVLTFEELEAVKQAARIAALEEAAEVAEDIEMDWSAWGPAETREAIAAAIRALKGSTDE